MLVWESCNGSVFCFVTLDRITKFYRIQKNNNILPTDPKNPSESLISSFIRAILNLKHTHTHYINYDF